MKKKLLIALSILIPLTALGVYQVVFNSSNTKVEGSEFNISIRDTITIDAFLNQAAIHIQSQSTFRLACALKRMKTINHHVGQNQIGAQVCYQILHHF